jgi:hypothetical protein
LLIRTRVSQDKNWTKCESNLSNHFSYIDTDIDPPIIAHGFPSLGAPDFDDDLYFRRVCKAMRAEKNWLPKWGKKKKKSRQTPSSSTAAYSGCPWTDDDDGSSFHRVRTPINIAQEEVDANRRDCDDDGGKEKKKNHLWTTTATKRTSGNHLSADWYISSAAWFSTDLSIFCLSGFNSLLLASIFGGDGHPHRRHRFQFLEASSTHLLTAHLSKCISQPPLDMTHSATVSLNWILIVFSN